MTVQPAVLPALAGLLPQEQAILDGAACRGMGAGFFNMPETEAKEVCATCEVTRECQLLGDLVESCCPARLDGGWPVWGGETLRERKARRKAA